MAAKYPIIIRRLHLTLVIIFMGVFVLDGCNSTGNSSPVNIYQTQEFEELIIMHCRARALREMRFELAEDLRKHTSMQNLKSSDSLKKEKARQSRELADSIASLIQQITDEMSLEDKRAFRDSVDLRIIKSNCIH
ncbi:MAG TPA: hypothetical protein VJ911_03555 [Cryomorphaceae bacterium]|nr:hypothetical protein [Cryomorphaceae bacterium]